MRNETKTNGHEYKKAEFINLDLRYFDKCEEAVKGMDYVFHLAGVKGSPKMTAERPSSFFVPQ